MHGVPNTAMQAYAPQLDDEELAAIITYERNAWEHDTGDLQCLPRFRRAGDERSAISRFEGM